MKKQSVRDRVLAEGKARLDRGDKAQILYMLDYCLARDVAIPNWLKQAFRAAYDAPRQSPKVKTWDQVFGPPRRKHSRAYIERETAWYTRMVVERVDARRRKRQRGDHFQAVGDELGISHSRARRFYYNHKHALKGRIRTILSVSPVGDVFSDLGPHPSIDLPRPHPAVLPIAFVK